MSYIDYISHTVQTASTRIASMYKYILLLPVLIVCTCLQARANTDDRTLLIINSYNEYAPWSRSISRPIAYNLAQKPTVHCEIANLNNILVTDSTKYFNTVDRLFQEHAEHHPDYVVLIGQMASTLLERIKTEWGDIPVLFVSRTETYGPLDYYFANYSVIHDYSDFKRFDALRDKYNFTMVLDPDYYRKTIDLMNGLIKNIDTLVFISDGVAINRTLNYQIKEYLRDNYPTIQYKWLQAQPHSNEALQSYFVNRDPRVGLLMSTWFYPVQSVQGFLIPSSGEVNILSGSINPVFSLRQAYMQYGAVGGFYPNYDELCSNIVKVVEAMIAGKSMRDIPFAVPTEMSAVIDYPEMINYGLSAVNCPENTIFINKPETFWEKNKWQLAVAAMLVLIVILLMIGKNIEQRRQIEVLERHKHFIDNMPIPFAKAQLTIDKKTKDVTDATYLMMNQSFENMLKHNVYIENKDRLFQIPFFAAKMMEAYNTRKPVRFEYKFEQTGRYYEFIFCINSGLKSAHYINDLDSFAIDITDRCKMENELKSLTRLYDVAINAANVIPWQWNLEDDTMVIDSYSLFTRYNRDVDNIDDYHKTVITAKEFLNTVLEEDQASLYQVRRDFLENKVKEFNLKYRLKVARKGHPAVEWVQANGIVSDYDKNGNPTQVIGSMKIIDEPQS